MVKLRNTGLIAAAALCIAMFYGCAGDNRGSTRSSGNGGTGGNMDEPGTFEGLSAETEKRIMQGAGAWGISEYYGTYNGWVVVRVNSSVPDDEERIVTIGGYEFSVLPPIIAWKDGQMHELKDAYDMGILTQEDIRSIIVKTPGIQWEEKEYWTGTIDEDFDGSSVFLIMDKNTGGVNKRHDKSFFGGIEIESIEDLTYFTIDADKINTLGINWEKWRQILKINLPGDNKENVVRAIRHLKKIDGIKAAIPNHSREFYVELFDRDFRGFDIFPPPPRELGKFSGLDAETELRIMYSRFNKNRSYSPILRYLGTYNGCVVIQFPYSHAQMGWDEKIDGIWFWDSTGPGIEVWKDGVFYRMTALYEQGLLTREDLLTIFDIHEKLKEAYFERFKSNER